MNLEDYYNNNIIGNQNIKIECGTDWSFISTTYRETRDTYLTALTEWYTGATTCLETSSCKTRVEELWLTIIDGSSYGTITQDMSDKADSFFYMMEVCDPFDISVYNNYIESLDTFRCAIEELTYLVDNEIVQVQ